MNFSILNKSISLVLVVLIFILSGCATIIAPRNQKVIIESDKNVQLTISGKDPIKKKGKYVIRKRHQGAQIVAKKDGYKTENVVIGTYKAHPLKKFVTLPLSIPVFFYPYLLDRGQRAYMFDKEFKIGSNMTPLPIKNKEDKEIQINKITADIKSENIKRRYFGSFKSFYKRGSKKKSKELNKKGADIKIENTIFSDLMNDILKNSGFIDTTDKVLKNSYGNNLFLNANITGLSFHQVGPNWMLYTDITIDWEVLDFYKKPIFSTTTTSTSGQFAIDNDNYNEYVYYSKEDYSEFINSTIQDAMEYGMIEFLSDDKVKTLLRDKSEKEKEENFEELTIPKSSKYVSKVSESIHSGVTIKTKNGHGSGFIISEEGHIITNYHVVLEDKDLKVITNDGKEFDAKILRVSRLSDLALLKIEAKGLQAFKINNSKEIEIGQTIYSIGTPSSKSLSQSVSKGIVSGVRDADSGNKMIQTDVSINSGNSGGALINKEGVVMGVVSSKLVGRSIEGVAFGIPAYEIFDKLKLK